MEIIIYNFIHNKDCWDYTSIIGTLICSLLSACFLILTYLLARKINERLDKHILEKQFNTVYKLNEELQNTDIRVDITEAGCKLFELNFSQIKSP